MRCAVFERRTIAVALLQGRPAFAVVSLVLALGTCSACAARRGGS